MMQVLDRLELVQEANSQSALSLSSKMSEKGVKYPLSWLLVDENIEGVERINLIPEIQQLLGCSINEYVFLEYPFAYVPAETVKSLANVFGSTFEPHKEKLELYASSAFLIGYASTELTSEDFIICLSEAARDLVVKRNRTITKSILNYARNKIEKTPRPWKSLGSEDDLDATLLGNARPYFEVEISLPICLLGRDRALSDRTADDVRDGYAKIVPQYEVFENVEMLLICKAVQTNLEGHEISVQTYPGYPKNEWTQYEYDCFPKEDALESEEGNSIAETENKEAAEKVDEVESEGENKKLKKTSSLEIFLQAHTEEIIDVIRYNTVINLLTDDISNLSRHIPQEISLVKPTTYKEVVSLINLSFIKKRRISSVSWHPSSEDILAICYVEDSQIEVVPNVELLDDNDDNDDKRDNRNENGNGNEHTDDVDGRDSNSGYSNSSSGKKADSGVVLWSLSDSLYPKMILEDYAVTMSVSFCPYKPDILIGGNSLGQVIIWDLRGLIDLDEKCLETPIVRPTATSFSSSENSHNLPIRTIQWLPSWCEIGLDGNFKKASNKSLQFITASDDGSLAIWDLRWQTNSRPRSKTRKTNILEYFDPKKLDGVLRPVYQLILQCPKDPWMFSPLSVCFPLIKGDCHDAQELDSRINELLRRVLVATLEGELINCSWEGEVFGAESSTVEKCNVISRSCIHDGPVLDISRCPYLDDVLLTIGGRVFAIWKDDYLDSSLLWRRSSCPYTACCWSNRPGIFLLGRCIGDFEVWDLMQKPQEPVLLQSVSGGPITGLYPRLPTRNESIKVIGICDSNGAFRIFTEPEDSKEEALDRIEWFEEFVWREVKKKRTFFLWESDFMKTNPIAIERKRARDDGEVRRKHQEAREKFQKEQEELARQKAERIVRMKKQSKVAIWKIRDCNRMEKVLLKKKGFVVQELEEARLPLVQQHAERNSKLEKAKQKVFLKEKYFKDIVSTEFPRVDRHDDSEVVDVPLTEKILENEKKDYRAEYLKIRDETRRILIENPYVAKFDWNAAMREGRRRRLPMKLD